MSQFGSIIAGTGSYVPEKRLTNDELYTVFDIYDDEASAIASFK